MPILLVPGLMDRIKGVVNRTKIPCCLEFPGNFNKLKRLESIFR